MIVAHDKILRGGNLFVEFHPGSLTGRRIQGEPVDARCALQIRAACLNRSVAYGCVECLVIFRCLVRIPYGESRKRRVPAVVASQITGNDGRVTGAGVAAGQNLTAGRAVIDQAGTL